MGIAYFPEIYEDELIYSVLARYFVHSGYLYYKDVEQDLFCVRQARVDKEFVKYLRPEIVNVLTKNMTLEELLEKHTMYPFYGRFIDGDRRNTAFQALLAMEGDFSKLFSVPNLRKGEQRYMRFCPACVLNDRERHGETYWHRLHQMRHVNLCPIHGCNLIDSSVSLDTTSSVNLVSAEEAVLLEEEQLCKYAAYRGYPLELKLSQYIAEVFQQPIDRNNMASVKDFLHSKMAGTPYLSSRGEHKYYHKLWEDMRMFYEGVSGIENITDGHLQRLLCGGRHIFSEICMVAMFLHIDAGELAVLETPVKPPEQQFDERVSELINSGMSAKATAREMGVSSSMVRMAIQITGKGDRNRKYSAKRTSVAKDWEDMDRQMLPLVKKAISELHGSGEIRPQKISFCAVSKKLNIPNHRLYKLERCKKEIERHIESREQYRARKVIWAVNALQREEKPLVCWRICHITKLEKEELETCLPYLEALAGPALFEMVKALL